jgi:hypothetical protein
MQHPLRHATSSARLFIATFIAVVAFPRLPADDGSGAPKKAASGAVPAQKWQFPSFRLLDPLPATVVAKVVTPDGLPAAQAKIAHARVGMEIAVINGEIDERRTTGVRRVTDDAGKFSFTPLKGNSRLVIIHPAGYACFICPHYWMPENSIVLMPWAKVEGTFRIGRKPQANTEIYVLRSEDAFVPNEPNFYMEWKQRTDANGRFIFDRVFAGNARIGRCFRNLDRPPDSTMSFGTVVVNLAGGKTTHVDLGASGRPVIGQLRWPAYSKATIPWNAARVVALALAVDDCGEVWIIPEALIGERRLSAKRTNGHGDSEMSSSVSIAVDSPPGQTAHVDLGTTGRPVIGQLRRPPESKPEVELKSAQVYIGQVRQQTSPEAQVFFQATPDHEGNFALEDLPPGNYWLSAFVEGQKLFHSHNFTIPSVNEKLSQRPVDLGVLTLSPAPRRGAAKVAK